MMVDLMAALLVAHWVHNLAHQLDTMRALPKDILLVWMMAEQWALKYYTKIRNYFYLTVEFRTLKIINIILLPDGSVDGILLGFVGFEVVGIVVGIEEGTLLGKALGTELGIVEGNEVGTWLGKTLGTELGILIGTSVGTEDGLELLGEELLGEVDEGLVELGEVDDG